MKNRVLVVDDNELDRMYIQSLIKSENNTVHQADSVEHANFLVNQYNYSLILSDIQMPNRDGFDFAHTLKQDKKTKEIPIVFITSLTKDEITLVKAYNSGVLEILDKKDNRSILKKKIDVFLNIGKERNDLLQTNKELNINRKLNEHILGNILPFETIKQLKENGKVNPRKYKIASVLFSDFVNFTSLSRKINPIDLISKLEFYFTAFDDIIDSHTVEKIKTIGDSYMCVGGIPIRNKSNPIDTVLVALKMMNFVNKQKQLDIASNKPVWDVRIGIHTGQLIAGVIGTKKYSYDVWGETVNIANRIEAFADTGTISISGTTNNYIKKYFETSFVSQGELKGVGNISIHKVSRLKDQYSTDKLGIYHNKELNNDFYRNEFGEFN
jgi:class 3 adenylate cyclase